MAYFSASISNEPMIGAVKVMAVKDASAPTDATSVRVYRRDMSTMTTVLVHTIPIGSVNNLTFSFLDKNVLSGRQYRYTLTPYAGATEKPSVVLNVDCKFDGVFISDSTGEFMAALNTSYKVKKNTPVGYVRTLASKYPHVVRNSLANYASGSVDGIFMPFTADCQPDIANSAQYKRNVFDMLSNGEMKSLRTHDGYGWLVSIDSDSSRGSDQFAHADVISFSWTEVGDFPTTGLVML